MVNDISTTSTASNIKLSNILAMDQSDADRGRKRKAEEMEDSPSPSPTPERSPSPSPAPYQPVGRSKTGAFPVRDPLVIPEYWHKQFINEQNDRISVDSSYSMAHLYFFDKLNKSFITIFNHAKD
jgi:hypothetical protein